MGDQQQLASIEMKSNPHLVSDARHSRKGQRSCLQSGARRLVVQQHWQFSCAPSSVQIRKRGSGFVSTLCSPGGFPISSYSCLMEWNVQYFLRESFPQAGVGRGSHAAANPQAPWRISISSTVPAWGSSGVVFWKAGLLNRKLSYCSIHSRTIPSLHGSVCNLASRVAGATVGCCLLLLSRV